MSKYVVVTGTAFDKLTIYGDPGFETSEEAIEWAAKNIHDKSWTTVLLQSVPHSTPAPNRWAIYDFDDESMISYVYKNYEECATDADQLDNSMIIPFTA